MKAIFPSQFNLKPEEIPVLALAYLGDAVYELWVREYLISLGVTKIDRLHAAAVSFVRADFQARAMRFLEEGNLSETEKAVARRGRNAKSTHPPRGASPEDYHYSTALEALVGFLYLKGEECRLQEIMEIIIQQHGEGNLF